MLYSMTGYGEARRQADGLAVAVEVRTINSRYFKLSYRATDGYASLEPRVEAAVRQQVRRGTVQVQVRVDRPHAPGDYRLNVELLESFRHKLTDLAAHWDDASGISLTALLSLPGVIDDVGASRQHAEEDWPLIETSLEVALVQLTAMRAKEGESLASDLAANCNVIAEHLQAIEARAPVVIENYRERISDRVNQALAELNVTIEPAELVREVSLFAERCDISEEVVRLRSHLEQFGRALQNEEAVGRKIEFIAQEMGRETNTIGSKANDTRVARHVVEMKTALERIREQIQNVE